MTGFTLPLLFVSFAGFMIWRAVKFERERREALQKLAVQLGFSYTRDASLQALGTAHGLRLFSLGHGQTVSNLMEQTQGDVRRAVFDYRYTTGSGKNRHSVRITVYLMEKSSMKLPRFFLRPENIFHKIGGAFGYQDIDFSNNPDFSSSYLLQGESAPSVQAIFPPHVLNFFAQQKGWQVEGSETAIIVCRELTTVKPEQLSEFLNSARQITELFA